VWVQTLWSKHGDIGPIPVRTFTRHDGQRSNLLLAPRPPYLWQPTELCTINNSTYLARDLLKTWICKTFIRPFLIRENKRDIPSTRLKCQRSKSPNQVDTKIHETNSRIAIRLMKLIVDQHVKKYDVHMSMHRQCITKVQKYATFSRSIYFYKSLYMIQAVPPPIIWSTKLYIQRQVLSNQYCCLLLSWMRWNELLGSSHRTCMTYTWCSMYSLRLLMMDGETVRNM